MGFTEEHIEPMSNAVKQVIEYCQDCYGLDCHDLLHKWSQNKEWLAEKIGGLTWRSPEKIQFNLGQFQLSQLYGEFIDDILPSPIADLVYGGMRFDNFLAKQGTEAFFNNFVALPVGEMSKGMRLSKSFKFFIPDEDVLRAIQDSYSQVVQKNKMEGYLYLSIHPLDYLSISETNHGWRSCHALDGEYRNGNLSYLIDGVTAVAYVADAKEEYLPHFPMPWNSKKWRMLLYCNPKDNIIYCGKQYPFDSNIIVHKLFDMVPYLQQFLHPTLIGTKRIGVESENPEVPTVYEFERIYAYLFNRFVPIHTLCKNAQYSLNYNDVTSSHSYLAKAAFAKKLFPFWFDGYDPSALRDVEISDEEFNDLKIKVGAKVQCPRCHEYYISEGDNYMVCDSCAHEFIDFDDEEDD